jgi:hypothetical protein
VTSAPYLRFETAEPHPHSGLQAGIFWAAYRLRDSGELSEYEDVECADALRRLQATLPIPTKFARTRNASHRNTHGLSWIKSSAVQIVADMYRLAEILQRHGVPVDVLKSSRPGYVVYEDEWQIVAEPFHGEQT